LLKEIDARFPIKKEEKKYNFNTKNKLNDPQGLVRKFKDTSIKKNMDYKDRKIQDIWEESDYFNDHELKVYELN